ncbi:DUF1120 domain-containing protein [Serratia fonticola]|uniref:DUF1120 domain-containing protein n=1 Tax=Serratia fonticola TaxID=47917 RepID=UPI0015C5CF1A|nr:DUF1120 domain-containing protein [Serratia fonticola]MBC3380840.1 DUF1120 domain-containing protein [Serratia fonticola]NYA40039.1 DUF1120 domain-containing protein [Serratia fonticola]
MKVQKTLLAMILAASVGQAIAADSVEVKVIGTILPAACKATLSGGGVLDYGDIPADTLNKDDITVLSVKTAAFAITCDGATKVALRSTDTRAGTSVAVNGINLLDTAITASTSLNGLGAVGGVNTGAYAMAIDSATLEHDEGILLPEVQSVDNGQTWTTEPIHTWFGGEGSILHSWGSPSPVAFTTMTGDLMVQAVINKASELDLSKPIVLDGLSNLELVYL